MGFFKRILHGGKQPAGNGARTPQALQGPHSCNFETLEPRQLLAADIHFGSVYFEEASGDDSAPDRIEITFEGGAEGTTLDRITINTDKALDGGLTLADVFFDTAAGGQGAFGHVPLSIETPIGFSITNVSIADGGTQLIIDLAGFTAGDKLVFTVDVDEMGFLNATAVAEGGEFEGTHLKGEFTAPHYHSATINAIYFDAFDPNFAAAAAQTGSNLNLPPDAYMPPDEVNRSDRTAGAVGSTEQVPLPITIAGTVFVDQNLDNDQDPGDTGIAGVHLTLLRKEGDTYVSTGLTAVTDADGHYQFDDPSIVPGTYRVVETQPDGYYSVGADAGHVAGDDRGTVLNSDVITDIALLGGEDSVENDFAEALPGSLSGYVYHDRDNDGNREAGEEGIGGVTIRVIPVSTLDGNGLTPIEVLTDSTGKWFVDGLRPGQYRVVEVNQPAPYYDGLDKAGSLGGSAVNPGEEINDIQLLSGQAGVEYNFGEILPGSISGRVIADKDGDCELDPDEIPLEGVRIDLLDEQGNLLQTTYTDADGYYSFTDLAIGTYAVYEHQPAGYFDGGDHVGTAGGVKSANDLISQIKIGPNVHGVNYDFCETPPSSISGRVHVDEDGDCELDPNELALEGVQIDLLDEQGNVLATTYTDVNGEYKFENLAPGTYTIHEHQPAAWFDGGDHVGSEGGVKSANDVISQIELAGGVDAVEYNFCELPPSSISGRVHVDKDGDCELDPDELALEGVQIDLLDEQGNVIATTYTDENGEYIFENLEQGVYAVHEHQPAAWFDGGDHVGSEGGVKSANDVISEINLGPGVDAVDYNFCELPPASISGRVHADKDGDCVLDPDETPLEGVRIDLLDAGGNVIRTTFTDVNGEYKFDNLEQGTYSVREHQPVGYFDGGDHIGSVGGVKAANDLLSEIVLGPGVDAVDYNFCEHEPVTISGHVYHDRDNNGLREIGEEGISGVTLRLLDAQGNVVATTQTVGGANAGYYEFTGLEKGTYTIVEVQPNGWLDGLDAPGNLGGNAENPGDAIRQVTIEWGETGVDYDFGELLPGSISGLVHADKDGDCELDPDELPLAGVQIDLLDSQGNVIATTFTDENGEYLFENLRPGTYGVFEHQPAGYFDSGDHLGSGGGLKAGNDLFTQIDIFSGDELVDYNFCETPPARISGFVFQDGATILTVDGQVPADLDALRDGQRTGDDTPIAGVTLELRHGITGEPVLGSAALPGTYPPGEPIRVVTNANGYYEFNGLPAGNYAVYEIHPDGYIDSRDTAGSNGGIAVNPTDAINPLFLFALTEDPDNDAIIRVALFAGDHSQENNFSEVLVDRLPPPPRTPDPQPDPPVFNPFEPVLRSVVPPIINTPQHLTPPDISGSDGSNWYTWHLSVVNGGYPRGFNVSTQPLITAANAGAHISAFTVEKLREGHWEVNDRDGNRVVLEFGAEGAIPVTGDFNGDGVTEVGIYLDGEWFIDVNGNGHWDPEDLWAKLGSADDRPVVGDWDGDGKDDIGIFGPAWPGDPTAIRHEPGQPDSNNTTKDTAKNLPPDLERAALGDRELKLSSVGSLREDLIDHVFAFGTPTDTPIVGDFNGDGIDTIAIFHDGQWHIDVDGDGQFTDADLAITFGQKGDKPLVGDFTGNGVSNVGVYRDGKFIFDTNKNLELDAQDAVFEMHGGEGVKPIVGDFNGDGIDEPGTYRHAG